MLKGLYTAYTGMIQEQQRMDTLTNNLANSDTTGFKKEGLTVPSTYEELVSVCHEFRKKGYENPMMGIYFISDPDGYWLEILPVR